METFPITITYQLVGKEDWNQIDLTPEQYFELEVEENPQIEISMERFNHAIEYLAIPAEILRSTRLIIEDRESGKRVETTEAFWNKGKNRLIERKDFLQGTQVYYQMIQEIQIETMPLTYEILRAIPVDNVLQPIFHSRIITNPDGSEREIIILSSHFNSTA